MKKIKFYLGLLLPLALASCATDRMDEPNAPGNKDISYRPTRSSEIGFLSNGVSLGTTRSFSSTPLTEISWDYNGSLKGITVNDEQKFVEEHVRENLDNREYLNLDNNLYVAREDLFLTLKTIVSKSDHGHRLGIFYYDAEGRRVEKTIIERMEQVWPGSPWLPEPKDFDDCLRVMIPKGTKFGFFTNGKDQNGQNRTFYSWSNLNEELPVWGKWPVEKESAHVGTFTHGDMTYICFEDWTDFDYNDLVLLCSGNLESTKIEGSEEDSREELKPDTDPTPDPEPDPTPEPDATFSNGSVEVNLALNAPHDFGDWLESHLSIHVRDTTDVEVFLPAPAEFYCSTENMMIIGKHDTDFAVAETTESMAMDINGTTVTLSVTYREDGIHVVSRGITADVLRYLRSTYSDGLTFEVRLFYNIEAVSREELKNALSEGSWISFTSSPAVYVNSYGRDLSQETLAKDPLACTVRPSDAASREKAEAVPSEREKAILDIYTRK